MELGLHTFAVVMRAFVVDLEQSSTVDPWGWMRWSVAGRVLKDSPGGRLDVPGMLPDAPSVVASSPAFDRLCNMMEGK